MRLFYVYLTTNLITNQQYVGKHSILNKDSKDTYLGSGYLIKLAILKYGKNNFKKEILEWVNNNQEAYQCEEKYIKLYKTHISQGGYNLNWVGHNIKYDVILDKEKVNKDFIRICKACHKEFCASRKDKLYCSLKCKDKAKNYKRRQPQVVLLENIKDKVCEICGFRAIHYCQLRVQNNGTKVRVICYNCYRLEFYFSKCVTQNV